MNRQERRALAQEMRAQRAAWPETLTEVPESAWPERSSDFTEWPIAVWRSRHFLVQMYEAPPHGDATVFRMTVNRVIIRPDGHWEQDISWEELMECKRQVGLGDKYAVEVYPRERDVVRDCNMRHLWVLSEPLGIGWVGK